MTPSTAEYIAPPTKKTIEKKKQNTRTKPLGFLSCFIIILIFWVQVQIWRPLIFVLLYLIDFKKNKQNKGSNEKMQK